MSTRHVIRDVKEDFDWEYYVDSHYSAKRVEGRNGLELRINCPSCGETKYKCYVNPDRGAFYCFKCDFKTGNFDLFDFVSLTEGITRGQALIRLVREHKPLTPEEFVVPEEKLPPKASPIRMLDKLPEGCVPLAADPDNPFWQYVSSRGFTPNDLVATGLHYTPSVNLPVYDSKEKYRGNLGRRIVFPIYGGDSELIAWLARGISEKTSPKYFNCPESDIHKTVWPFSRSYGESAVLCEGIIDALSIRRVAGQSAYATFGKRVSLAQIELLKHWGVTEVTVWYDKDARRDTIKTVETLQMHFQEVFVPDLSSWPGDKDTGYFLSDIQGPAIIGVALEKRINTYSLEYERWKMQIR